MDKEETMNRYRTSATGKRDRIAEAVANAFGAAAPPVRRSAAPAALSVTAASVTAALLLALPLLVQAADADGARAVDVLREPNWLLAQIRLFRAYPHLHRAYRFLSENDLDGAAKELRAVLAVNPQDAEARLNYLNVLYRRNETAAMREQAELLLRQRPGSIDALLYRAIAERAAGDADAALADFRAVRENRSANRANRVFAAAEAAALAISLRRDGDAIAALLLLRELDDGYDVDYRLGVLYDRGRNDAAAEQAFATALKLAASPEQARQAHAALGYVAQRMGRNDEAIRQGRAVLETDPGNLDWLRTLAYLEYGRQDAGAAITLMRRALAVRDNAADRLFLANLLRADGQTDAAIDAYAKARDAATEPDTRFQAAMSLGYLHAGAGRQREAEQAFTLALRTRPDDAARQALDNVRSAQAQDRAQAEADAQARTQAQAQAETQAQAQARAEAEASEQAAAVAADASAAPAAADAAADAPSAPREDGIQVRMRRAAQFLARGEPERAARMLDGVAPRNAAERRYLAGLHAEAGNVERAASLLAPLVSSSSSSATAEDRLTLAEYFVRLQQPERALEALDAVLAGTPAPALRQQALRRTGYLLAGLGRGEQAAEAFDRLLRDGGGDAAVRMDLGFLLVGLARYQEAAEQFGAVLADGRDGDGRAALGLARCLAAMDRRDEALRAYAFARETAGNLASEDRIGLYNEFAYLASLAGDDATAYRNWLDAAQLRDDVPTQLHLAYAEQRLGMGAEAAQRLDRIDAAGLDPAQRADLYDRQARLFESAGDIGRAADYAAKASEAMPSAERHYALALYAIRQSRQPEAIAHLRDAAALAPDNAEYALQLAYLCKQERDDACTIGAFETAARLQPRRAAVAEELGYAHARAGDNDEAVAWFKKAIDLGLEKTMRQSLVTRLLPEPADAAGGSGLGGEPGDRNDGDSDNDSSDASRVYRLRQQVRDMSRRYQFNAYQSYRASARSNVASIAPGFQTGGLIPSQGGVEFLYQPPGIGYRDGRTFRVFSRLLWSNELGSLRPDPHSLQAGLGVQFKPFREQDAYLSLERLVKGGNQSQDNWLVRGSWGWSDGYELKPGVPSWNQTIVYLDAGYFVQHGPIKSTFGEVRQGRSFNYRNLATITPHLLLAGRRQWPDPAQGSYAEAGAGVAIKMLFNETRYEAPRSSVEFTVQYRKTLNRSLPGGWVLSASAQF